MGKKGEFRADIETIEDDAEDRASEHNPVPPPRRLIVKRGGHSITHQILKPVVLVDTRERDPFDLSDFPNWIGGERRKKLGAGDYSVEGMESMLALERKTLSDLITTVMQYRPRFFRMCERPARCRWKALLIEASYEDVKYPYDDEYAPAHSNAVSGTLDALEAKYGIPVIYTSSCRPLAEEKAASWLSKHST